MKKLLTSVIAVLVMVSCASAQNSAQDRDAHEKQLLTDAQKSAGYLKKGKKALLEENFSQAVTLLEKSTAREAVFFLALAHMNLGEHDAARDLFKKSISGKVRVNESRYNLGLIAHEKGNTDKAVTLMQSVTADDPGHTGALFFLASHHYGQKEYKRAADLYRAILKKHPAESAARKGLFYVHISAGRPTDAWETGSAAIVKDPSFLVTVIRTGLRVGKYDAVGAFLSTCREKNLLPASVANALTVTITGSRDGLYSGFRAAEEGNVAAAVLRYISTDTTPIPVFYSGGNVVLRCGNEVTVSLTVTEDGVVFEDEQELVLYDSFSKSAERACEEARADSAE